MDAFGQKWTFPIGCDSARRLGHRVSTILLAEAVDVCSGDAPLRTNTCFTHNIPMLQPCYTHVIHMVGDKGSAVARTKLVLADDPGYWDAR
eukprot:9484674-Pyramimonas_sp.AAC.1